jgi:class 3 adenylate cyclase
MPTPLNNTEFSRIRHDLRTPVNHILGYSEMLLEDETLPPEFHDDLRRVHTGGRVLLSLIKDYFDDEHFASKRPGAHRMHHELRTPVNHIVGYTELLTELAEERALSHLRADFEKIGHAAGVWLALMEEYLLTPGEPRIKAAAVALTPGIGSMVPELAEEPAAAAVKGTLLVVDDDAGNRDMLARRLSRMGHSVDTAASGEEALLKLGSGSFDVVLLDLVMPGLDGYQVLTLIKTNPLLAETRVIMLSALDDEKGVARCIETGADDYLAKPLNPVFLRARLGACLEKKALRDRERRYLADIQAEREKSDRLLRNILPQSIADRLKRGETMIADHFDCSTVLFADLVGFTPLSRTMTPLALVELLNEVFTRFDELAGSLGLEKIKTIGDAYMVVAGVPIPRADHAQAAVTLALRMHESLRDLNAVRGLDLHLRTGLHSGPLAAGIIGRHKFSYDLWGDTVNIASRMESSAPLNTIHVSAATAALLGDAFPLLPRGFIPVKGIGEMETWTLQEGTAS